MLDPHVPHELGARQVPAGPDQVDDAEGAAAGPGPRRHRQVAVERGPGPVARNHQDILGDAREEAVDEVHERAHSGLRSHVRGVVPQRVRTEERRIGQNE